jgi:hypothetical protein
VALRRMRYWQKIRRNRKERKSKRGVGRKKG